MSRCLIHLTLPLIINIALVVKSNNDTRAPSAGLVSLLRLYEGLQLLANFDRLAIGLGHLATHP